MDDNFKDFTLKDCATILKKKLNTTEFTVTSFKYCPLSDKLAFLGEHCYLDILYDENGENKSQRFFAKALAILEETQQAFLIENGGFAKECIFYNEFVSDLLDSGINVISDCVTTCYFVSDMKFFIFDDLSSLNYKTINSKVPLDLDLVKVGLEALAKMHCSGFTYEEKMKAETGIPFRLDKKYPELFKESFFPNSEPGTNLLNDIKMVARNVIDLLENAQNLELFKRLTEETIDHFREFIKPSEKFRNTISHGDLWSPNFMFKFENDKPIHSYIIDFQMQRYSPPALDVMCFIHLSMHQELRRKYLKDLINYYYEKCSKILKDYNVPIDNVLPYEDFIESCDYFKAFAICTAINQHSLSFTPAECSEYLADNDLKEVFIEQGKL